MATRIRTSIAKTNPYYISKHEYLAARHFALQYPEWKKQKQEITSRINYGFRFGEVHSTSICSPVEKAAELSERYSLRMELIERIAKIAGEDIWEFVLLGVTTECSYEYLRLVKDIPCCKEVYYKMYRKFFWLLNKELLRIFDIKIATCLMENLNIFEEENEHGKRKTDDV